MELQASSACTFGRWSDTGPLLRESATSSSVMTGRSNVKPVCRRPAFTSMPVASPSIASYWLRCFGNCVVKNQREKTIADPAMNQIASKNQPALPSHFLREEECPV